MEDDIDDLLDEVESKYCRENKPKASKLKPASSSTKTVAKPSKSTRSQSGKGEDDLNDMIRDICLDDGPDIVDVLPRSGSESSRPNSGKNKPQALERKKCFRLILGGSIFSKGLCTVSEERSCDKLRCTSCDFDVVMFDNFEWHQDCDYLFFRNNVPDFQRLKSKLTTKKGYRAYACQCTWRSVTHPTEVQLDPKLKWVCGKHS